MSQNTTATDNGVDSHKKATSVDVKGVATKDGSTGWLQLLLVHCAFQLIKRDAQACLLQPLCLLTVT